MPNKLTTIVFILIVFILILLHIKIIHSRTKNTHEILLIFFVDIIILVIVWTIIDSIYKEKYEYKNAHKSGKIVAGTVYADYPEQVGGLGWIN